MTGLNVFEQDRNKNCLTDDDLYLYISREGDSEKLGRIEAHCAGCPDCRRALAEVLGLLQSDSGQQPEEIPEPGEQELLQTIELIQDVAGKERSMVRHVYTRLQWPVAAMLILGFAYLAFWGLSDFSDRNKSKKFYLEAKNTLEQLYSENSPSNLRLDMPFDSAPRVRNREDLDLLRRSQNLFNKALGVRENMAESRLGLAWIYLKESNFKLAAEEFQSILDHRNGDVRALIGRGVTRYEEALQSDDPVQYRSLLIGALDDFNEALRNDPDSFEALYNKIWVLYESGRHEEALQEIEGYLAGDEESIWAEALKGLRIRMGASSSAVVEEEVQRAAFARDASRLMEIARYAPYQMPAAIWTAMRESLALEEAEEVPDRPNAEDMKWAAEIMESAYRTATGDRSFLEMIQFYKDLSPPERIQKKTSDELFETLKELQENERYADILHRSVPLEKEYSKIQDFWQLFNLHHLRGNCFYIEGDFARASEELSEMLRIARRLDSPELIARALFALASVKGQQQKFDESMQYTDELNDIFETHDLDSWRRYTSIWFGYQYLSLGHYDRSMKENTAALKSARRLSDVSITAEALENIGTIMERLGRLGDARSFYDSAFQTVEEHLSKKPERGNSQLGLRQYNLMHKQGELSLRTGNPNEAISYFEKCLGSIPSGMMHELAARNRIGLVEAFLKKRQNSEAATVLETVMAVDLAQYPNVEWKAWLFRGRLLEDAQDYNGARASYEKAIETVEGIRTDIDSMNLRRSFFSERFDPYREVIGLLYRDGGSRQLSLEYVDRAKSMTLREYLNLPDTGYGQNKAAKTPEDSEDPFRVLEYFFSQDELLIFVTGPDDRIIETASMELSRDTVAELVQECIQSVQDNDVKSFGVLSNRLYGELIDPIEQSALSGFTGPLIVLPDGPLHLLPFAGLRDDRGRFLIEKNPVVYAPSRSVFQHCLARARNIPAGSKQDVVLIDGTKNLPSAKEELIHLSNLYGSRAKVLGIKELSEFRAAVTGSEILHFSGHSVARQGMPVLVLQQSPQEEYLDGREIGTWKLPQCRLVNLAGCNTGVGPISDGESPWGLVPEFLNAGAPAIVASLMQVDDASTRFLTRRFYELLNKGADKATALQKAQTALLNQSSGEIQSLSWIPYILIGDPL